MRQPFGNFEDSPRRASQASYRRFRRRRGAWPVLSTLALASILVGAGMLVSPDRIDPTEMASVEETVSDSPGSGGAQSENAEPENSESQRGQSSSETDEPAATSSDEGSPPEPRAAEQEAQREEPEEDAGEEAEERPAAGAGEDSEQRDTSPPPPEDKDMSLTVPRLGLQGDSVVNSADPQALHEGAQKLPSTGFPWQDGANTYIAGHRIGYPGTESHNQFYNLPSMQQGDSVYLTDANGETYEYRVTEIFAVTPSESWVTEPEDGRDMVTLQTCTHSPDDWWSITPQLYGAGPESGRLVVRADRV